MDAAYLDHNATTRLDPRVLDAMLPYLREQQGNPASRHGFGRRARTAIALAREQVAAAVGAHPSQVVFVSGGTEADNLAILGITAAQPAAQIAVSAIEHPAVLRSAVSLRNHGWQVAKIAVDGNGRLDMDSLRDILQHPTALVSVMAANNETGVLQELVLIGEEVRRAGTILHTDAVQALGKIPLDFYALGVAAMSLSAHKIYGPQGVGALVVDKRVDIRPLVYGGGQEKGLRSGTENIAAIVGFGLACELAQHEWEQRAADSLALRQQLEAGLRRLGAVIFGAHAPRLPNTSFFAFPDIEGETLVGALDRKGFAVASGSACSSDSPEPSHVLMAMGVESGLARGAVRISLGVGNTAEQIKVLLQVLEHELMRLRNMAAIAV